MTYKNEKLKTKEDYINLLLEIEAYRSLDGQDFDFGDGLIINEMSYGSEDAYYEMDIQMIEDILEYWDYDRKSRVKKKIKPNRRELKQKEKNKIEKLKKISWVNAIERDGWLQRCYRGSRSAYLKKLSNKKIRRNKKDFIPKGNLHHRVFNFWYELY